MDQCLTEFFERFFMTRKTYGEFERVKGTERVKRNGYEKTYSLHKFVSTSIIN